MRIRTIYAPVILSVALCGFGCTKKFSKKKAQKNIEETLAAQGIKVKAVCPEIKKNATNKCTATTEDGKVIKVDVITSDDKGRMASTNIAIGKKVEKLITSHFTTKYKLTLTDVKCPQLIMNGETATCTSKSDGVDIPFTVKGKGTKARFEPTSGIVVSERMVELIKQKLPGTVSADCGAAVRVSKPGTRFTCKATGPNGQTKDIHVKITDTKGGIVSGFKPPA